MRNNISIIYNNGVTINFLRNFILLHSGVKHINIKHHFIKKLYILKAIIDLYCASAYINH